jgi:GNAT superfamily N-acetyltransferase
MSRISTSRLGLRDPRHHSAPQACSSYGFRVAAADRILDPELARRLVLHEAKAQQIPGRELRDLGDAWLFHDVNDPEPFWNRLIAPRWPVGQAAFDRRLDDVITLFATLGRAPHIRPLAAGGSPLDLASRLVAAGFDALGADRRMVFADATAVAPLLASARARVAAAFGAGAVSVASRSVGGGSGVGRSGRRGWTERRRSAADASIVLEEAFAVDPPRRPALENDVLACLSRPRCSIVLVEIEGEPAAVARRAWTGDGSYLSSIGTRPRFRNHGLGALVTLLAVLEAVDAGSEIVHLAVEIDNSPAQQLYERLGFALVGDASPDLLLH